MNRYWIVILFLLFSCSLIAQNNSFNFDGTNDYVDLGDTLDMGYSDFTIEAWVYMESNPGNGNKIINKGLTTAGQPSNGGYGMHTSYSSSAHLQFHIGDSSSSTLATNAYTFTLMTWHHIAGVRSGKKILLYLDGILVDQDSSNWVFNVNTNMLLTIGNIHKGPNYSANQHSNGNIDEVRIWNVARTQADIQYFMNHDLCSYNGLLAYYRFDQGIAGSNNSGINTVIDELSPGITGLLKNTSLTGISSNWDVGRSFLPSNVEDTIVVSSCNSYTSPSGNYVWTTPGWYVDTIHNPSGCDSIIHVDLSLGLLDTSVVIYGNTMISQANNAQYQWLRCEGVYHVIPGANGPIFSPPNQGYYAVAIQDGNCMDTSACHYFTPSALEDYEQSIVKLYPNPVKSILNIDSDLRFSNYKIYSIEGRLIEESTLISSEISLESIGSGFYILELVGDNRSIKKMIIKE